MEVSENTYVLFDGDQKRIAAPIDLNNIPPNEQDTSTKLKNLIKKQIGCDIKFHIDGGNQSNEIKERQIIDLSKKYLKFYKEKVFYLPSEIPEDIIWDEEFAKQFSKLLHPKTDFSTITNKSNNSKEMIFNFCLEYYGDSNQYNSTLIQFIANWLNKKDENYTFIKDLIHRLKNLN
ncbi:hypothetical protein N9L20_01970 [Flavobacteriaceae bacterium]|nr:hypothetical protein [Flavobacteriaceae bacterium]